MPKSRSQKEKEVAAFLEGAKQMKSAIFIRYSGLSVKDERDLRKQLREVGGSYQVLKKTLLKRAMESLNLSYEEIGDTTGSFAVVFSLNDEISAAKTINIFSKTHPQIKIIAGMYGSSLIAKNQVLALATLPTKTELLAQLVSVISSPLRGLANVLEGPIRGVVQVIHALQTKNS